MDEIHINNSDVNEATERSVEEIENLLETAKLDKNVFHPHSQILSFADTFEDEKCLKLLQVDAEMLTHLCQGGRVTIRGGDDDTTILCTDSKTYEVIEAEQSNSFLISSDLFIPQKGEQFNDGSRQICKSEVQEVHHIYYEVKHTRPRFCKLFTVLNENLFSGVENETNEGKRYSMEDLLQEIQSSEHELEQKLAAIMAYQIDGYWRCLEFDYHMSVLSLVLNLINSNSWALDNISKVETLRILDGLQPDDIMSQCFEYFFEKQNETNDKGEELYAMREKEVSRFCAEILLIPARQYFLNEFQTIWQQSVPAGISTHISDLRGLAIVDSDSTPLLIKYLPVTELPTELPERFDVLFDKLPKWTFDEIEPYLIEYASKGCSVKVLLFKYARVSKQGGLEYYMKRHSR